MKRNTTLFLSTFLASVILGMAPSVVLADELPCSLASLNGHYAIERQGTVVAQLPGFPAPPAPLGEAALADLDGNGNLSAIATVNIGGLVLRVPVTGTYTVKPDCTGTATINTGLGLILHNAIVLIDGGKRFIGTETDTFQVVQTRGEKLSAD